MHSSQTEDEKTDNTVVGLQVGLTANALEYCSRPPCWLAKEKCSYEKEITSTEEKIEKMKAEGKDEYDIKKMNEVLQESKMMVPDAMNRLRKAYDDLEQTLEKEKDLNESEEYKAAQTALEDGKKVLEAS
ncbi:hypothetical protein FSP39_019816 [Pinctada imbricata]|uniref:Tubulin-specific chaperone A n=1 Tax=Pinctada imbricata TaxID=66713 RepID=A0AA88YFV4_PINIB|nr:hypothetical protein FSP39_019816 [Pinctada imbricata]